MSLRIQVHEQDPLPATRQRAGEVHRGGGLPAAALLIHERQHLQRAGVVAAAAARGGGSGAHRGVRGADARARRAGVVESLRSLSHIRSVRAAGAERTATSRRGRAGVTKRPSAQRTARALVERRRGARVVERSPVRDFLEGLRGRSLGPGERDRPPLLDALAHGRVGGDPAHVVGLLSQEPLSCAAEALPGR